MLDLKIKTMDGQTHAFSVPEDVSSIYYFKNIKKV